MYTCRTILVLTSTKTLVKLLWLLGLGCAMRWSVLEGKAFMALLNMIEFLQTNGMKWCRNKYVYLMNPDNNACEIVAHNAKCISVESYWLLHQWRFVAELWNGGKWLGGQYYSAVIKCRIVTNKWDENCRDNKCIHVMILTIVFTNRF